MTVRGTTADADRLQETRRTWDAAAATFDDEPDHGLNDPRVRTEWSALLARWLPSDQRDVLDAGCGTGSLSLLLAGLGHRVTGIEISPAMLDLARAKAGAHGYAIDFHLMDAAEPQFPPQSFDAIVCRHVLWTLPEPARVLERWATLLMPGGRLVLIEGWWNTGAGLHATEVTAALPAALTSVAVEVLSDQPVYWSKPVDDERYVVVADRVT